MSRPLVRREVRDAVRRYWFLVNAGLFLVGGLLMVLLGQGESTLLGSRGYERALAGLMQLALVFVPLMALVPATAAIAGEREAGTLDYLLAQPIGRARVFADKWLGVAAAVTLSVALGLAFTSAVAAFRGVPPLPAAALVALTLLLAVAFVSLGLWISAGTASRTRAASLGLSAWLLLVGLGSLGIMSAFVRWGLPPMALQAWAIVNPVEAYRLGALVALGVGDGSLGAVGQSLIDGLGAAGLLGATVGSLVAWSAAGFALGRRSFARLDRG